MLRRPSIIFVLVLASSQAGAVEILKKEPAKGMLRYGEMAYVDNGKCPKGQVEQVTGGRLPSRAGRQGAPTPREYACVPRP